MIELEIQALALEREGLLLETGRLAGACGFTLVRQRLVPDPHGALLSMVVRGSWFKRRALKLALEHTDRFVSVALLPAGAGFHPHFGATRQLASGYVPPPAPVSEPMAAAPSVAAAPLASVPSTAAPAPVPALETETWEALVTRPAPPVPPPSTVEVLAWDATPVLAADVAAVDQALADLAQVYPRILPRIQALDRSVAPGARAATLELAGRRVGAWLAARTTGAGERAAADVVERLALPALRDLVEVTLGDDGALHILHSPLCQADGHSGCGFYGGLLEGRLAPHAGWRVVPVCCASFGADACIIAISE